MGMGGGPCGAAARREGCGGPPQRDGARLRRDGASANPRSSPIPSAARGQRPKMNLESGFGTTQRVPVTEVSPPRGADCPPANLEEASE